MDKIINLDKLTHDDLLALIEMIYDRLPLADLNRVRDLADHKRRDKLEKAKNEVIAEMKSKEIRGINQGRNKQRDNASQLPPKYISPKGETWSGRGHPPQWIRDLEEEGQDREDYRTPEEG